MYDIILSKFRNEKMSIKNSYNGKIKNILENCKIIFFMKISWYLKIQKNLTHQEILTYIYF